MDEMVDRMNQFRIDDRAPLSDVRRQTMPGRTILDDSIRSNTRTGAEYHDTALNALRTIPLRTDHSRHRRMINPFSGSKGENISRFLRSVRADFSMNPYLPDGFTISEALAEYIAQMTKGTARRYIDGLPDDVAFDAERLEIALRQRFPVEDLRATRRQALYDMNRLEQGKKTLNEYVDEARDIIRNVPDMDKDIADYFVRGLSNPQLMSSAAGATARDALSFEELVDTVRNMDRVMSVSRPRDSETRMKDAMSDMDPRDRAMVSVMKDFMKTFVEQAAPKQQYGSGRKALGELSSSQQNAAGKQKRDWSGQGEQTKEQTTPSEPRPARFTGDAQDKGKSKYSNVQCFRCGEYGHTKTKCEGRELPRAEQDRLAAEQAERREVRTRQMENRQQVNVVGATEMGANRGNIYLDDWTQDGGCNPLASLTTASTDNETMTPLAEGEEVPEICVFTNKRQAPSATETRPLATRPVIEAKFMAPQGQRIRAVQDQQQLDVAATLQGIDVKIPLWQILDMSSMARQQIAQALTFDAGPALNTRKRAAAMATDDQEPPQKAQATAVVVDPICSVKADLADRQPPEPLCDGTFYAEATVDLPGSPPFAIKKALIDGGASVNLISERIAEAMKLQRWTGRTLIATMANGTKDKLTQYVHFPLTVAGVQKPFSAYIVRDQSVFSVLLARTWMRDNNLIGAYGTGEYFIGDGPGQNTRIRNARPTANRGPQVGSPMLPGRSPPRTPSPPVDPVTALAHMAAGYDVDYKGRGFRPAEHVTMGVLATGGAQHPKVRRR